jgi:hypothetical protein
VAIAAGEAMAERHALEALLPPSTDNTAGLLARANGRPPETRGHGLF